MFNPVTIFFLFLTGIICLFIGYMGASIRLGKYLKKYYPEVNFQEHPKKRLEIIEKRKIKYIPEADEFNIVQKKAEDKETKQNKK